MKKLNPPAPRNRYFLARVVASIAFLAAMTFLIARTDSTSRAQGGCTTDPVVANNLDSGAGSLRQAIADACAGSTITFNMTTVTSPISLTSAELLINKNLTITGPGATTLTVERSSAQATPHFRIFNVSSGTVTISGLTVTNGRAPDGLPTATFGLPGGAGGGILSTATSLTLSDVHLTNNRAGDGANATANPGEGGRGGAVYNENGSLSITNSTITGNSGGNSGFSGAGIGGGGGGSGGGIFMLTGTMNLTNVTINDNTAGNSLEPGSLGGHGGGIFTNTFAITTLTNCTVSNNTAGDGVGGSAFSGFGGGIHSDGPMTVIGSTISSNTSENVGGGIFGRVSLTLINSTISGNSGGSGGGILKDIPGTLSLTNSTITNNTASSSNGGVSNASPNASVRNTIIAGNAGQDATGTFNSLGNNIIGNSNTAGFVNGVNGDKVGTNAAPLNPGLAPLANNGGPTQTHALLINSLAFDAGNNCVVDNTCVPALGMSLTTDQRGAGFTRLADGADLDLTETVDIGAFEARASIEDISNKSTAEDTFSSFSFPVGDISLITSVTATSSNQALIPDANLNVVIGSTTRSLNMQPAPNQFGTATITVTVTSGTESISDTFVLTVTPVNDAPTDISLSNDNVADNSPGNTLVGTFASIDPDPLQTFTYSLVSGAGSVDNASFSISGDQLRTASTFDFETKPVFSVRVRSTDAGGLFFEKQFLINVIDAADNPGAIAFSSSVFSVGEADGTATITLTRTGGTDNRVSAKVNIADITTSPADYGFAPGSLDTSFNTGTGATSGSSALSQVVNSVVLQPDGKILIGGAFLFYNGVPRNRVARINANGSLDASFNPGAGPNTPVLCMALQADGKILIGGEFVSVDGTSRFRIARLNSNGALDLSFANVVPNDVVRAIVVQPDGKILIGGDFSQVNGEFRNNVARLNDDGSLDSFEPEGGPNGAVTTLALQPDGKVIVGGGFTNFGTATNTRVVRLTSSGGLDATFSSALGVSLAPRQVLLQPDGKILVAGEFVGVDTPFGKQGIARLETNGAADGTFNPGFGTDGPSIEGMALQPDSKIVIVGGFPTFNGTTVNGVARLESGGSLDSSFNSGGGVNVPFPALDVVIQPDGKIVMGGQYTFYSGVSSNGITRINGDLFVTWAPGDSANKSVSLPIVDDVLDENNETLSLQVVPFGASVGVPSLATLTIVDNDPLPTVISAISGSGTFGGTATLTATLTSSGAGVSGKTISFTLNGSSVGNATTNASGVATLSGVSLSGINAGSYPNAVGASFAGDAPANLAGSSGTGPLTVSKATTTTALSSSVNPSEFGQSVTFTATVTGTGGTPTGTVQFKDGNSNLGSAQALTAGVAQLTVSSLTSGTHTITAVYSGDTNFLGSTGTLAGGQVVKVQPTLTINDVSVTEGNSGTTNLVFTVTLSAASALTVSVNFATADGTATTSDNDYESANGTLTFNPGDLTKSVTVVVNGDQKFELDETVLVNLTTPVNAAVADAQGVGTIQNDDTLQLILDELGPAADQAAALESFLLTRDPFKVLSIADWFDFGGATDRNTRVLIFAANLTLNQGELPSSVVVNLVDGNSQTHDVPAQAVHTVPNTIFTEVVFRLPDTLAPGVCHVTIKAQGRTSNTGTIRIVP